MGKHYNLKEVFRLKEGTRFKTIVIDAKSDHKSEVMVRHGILHYKSLGEWRECLLTENWLNSKFEIMS